MLEVEPTHWSARQKVAETGGAYRFPAVRVIPCFKLSGTSNAVGRRYGNYCRLLPACAL